MNKVNKYDFKLKFNVADNQTKINTFAVNKQVNYGIRY